MNREYVRITISVEDSQQDALIADLADLELGGFEQRNDLLLTYVEKEKYEESIRERLANILDSHGSNIDILSEEVIREENWNEKWEQSIKPLQVGIFFIRSSWEEAETPEGLISLEIDPKMSFGTGYHETTRLMLQQLPAYIDEDTEVLDAGTGTGILAIAAVKCGARQVTAFDTNEWSYRNAQENIKNNGVEKSVSILEGSIEVVGERKLFDVILANINRKVIEQMAPDLVQRLRKNGVLILSGLKKEDVDYIKKHPALHSLTHIATEEEGEWIAMALGNYSRKSLLKQTI